MRMGSGKRSAAGLVGALVLSGPLVGLVAVGAPTVTADAATSHSLGVPAGINFGNVTLGDVYLQSFAATNTSTSEPATITGASESGDMNDFAVLPDLSCPYVDQNTLIVTLPPGASCDLDYFFNPGVLGPRSATITLLDEQTPVASVPVSGTGTIGYYQVSSTGQVAHFGDAGFFGDASNTALNHPVVGIAQTGDNGGYWLAASDGGVFNYGDAPFEGSAGSLPLNKPIVGVAPTVDSQGYWLVASDGGIFSYGDAQFYGSTGAQVLNKPIVGMAATNDGGGYWLVASDGGIFAYGTAQFYGSTGSMHLNQPIVGMAPTPDDNGYWLVASDGGIFAFGDAQFYGSAGSLQLAKPITGMAPMPDGNGYWFTASDGGLFNYGTAPFYGAANTQGLTNVVGMATDGAPTLQALLDSPAVRRHTVTTEHAWPAPPSGRRPYAGS
jgi:hypothetical protein